ncbi:MAG: ACT domain-containing protein [archaeon]
MTTRDNDEITVVALEEDVEKVNYSSITKWFKLFEIRPKTPFLAVGFIATITKELAATGLNVLVVSTYSKDYILLKEEDAEKGVNVLKEMGMDVR